MSFMKYFTLIGAVLTMLFPQVVNGETLETQMAEFARRVTRACQRHDADSIVIDFQSPIYRSIRITNPKMAEHASQVLQRLAIEELGKSAPPELKVASSPFTVRGSASLEGWDLNTNPAQPDTTPALVVANIGGELHNEAGELLATIAPVEVSDPEQLIRLFGVSFGEPDGGQDGGATDKIETLPERMIDPDVPAIDGTKVRAKADSKFAVQVLVGGVAVQPRLVDGGAMIDLSEEDSFVVRTFNDAAYDVATELYLDGVHSNYFRGARFYRLMTPDSWSEFEGWRTSKQRVYQFRITPYENSVAAELGVSSDVGLLHVTFRRTWPRNETPPLGETKSKSFAIGRGEEVEGRQLTQVQRDFGEIKASVVIGYQRK